MIVNDNKRTFTVERVSKIADYFNVSTDYLLGRTDNPNIADDKEKFYFEGKKEKRI